ncbi:hypothetical protein Cni_G14448 [Canna indica]|uniref:SWIM-type domain-containing protein n=1 Tax=Canna indica TaxID=4628 RepID=A0AAQ3KCY4_9LILI|nr:hypothetical protein Cni_G14448 [Canna indica]
MASFMKDLGAYQVRRLMDEHTCSLTFKNSRVNSTWLARHYISTIRAMPTIKLMEFKKLVKEQLGVEVSRFQCKRAKEKVYDILVGDSKSEYALMWAYADELRRSNKGSTVQMMVQRPIPTDPSVFDRFYVCFEAVRIGFMKGCRPIICVDGCFLKTVAKGQLLTAIGRDWNDQMFPLAWAVVQVESHDTRSWFLKLLKEDLNITYGFGWTIISDQQKGLVPAIAELLPNAEHRMCARHIYANWGGSHKGPKIQKQFWIIAKSTTEADFRMNIQELQKMSPHAYEDLPKRPNPRHWCKAFFNPMVKCDIVDNKLCEAFNGRILEARCKTIYSMLEDIRKLVIERIHTQRFSCEKWKKGFGPRIVKKLDENLKLSKYCHIGWNGEDGYQITAWGIQYVVDIKKMTCDCRAWQLTGISCCHAICALLDNAKQVGGNSSAIEERTKTMDELSAATGPRGCSVDLSATPGTIPRKRSRTTRSCIVMNPNHNPNKKSTGIRFDSNEESSSTETSVHDLQSAAAEVGAIRERIQSSLPIFLRSCRSGSYRREDRAIASNLSPSSTHLTSILTTQWSGSDIIQESEEFQVQIQGIRGSCGYRRRGSLGVGFLG